MAQQKTVNHWLDEEKKLKIPEMVQESDNSASEMAQNYLAQFEQFQAEQAAQEGMDQGSALEGAESAATGLGEGTGQSAGQAAGEGPGVGEGGGIGGE